MLILGLGLIFLAAELFTNAIEWFGKRCRITEGAVGSVLAAVGTALPETSVAVVAIIKGGGEEIEAGIGAILGAPMMLSTLAMFITGASVLVFAAARKRSRTINADYRVVGRDLRSFFLVYLLAFVAGVTPGRWPKLAIAVILVAIYANYIRRTFASPDSAGGGEEMRPLHFHRRADRPQFRWVLVQLASGLALMILGAMEFVTSVTVVAKSLGVSTLVLSLIITPIATELPEKFNSVTWMRHRKDTLALGNITGAMVFQSSLLPAIGIAFTPWVLDAKALASIGVAVLATSVAWADMTLRKRLSPYTLLLAGSFYALYPLFVFVILPRL
jgi:cation:H+ antiporter